MHCSRFWTWGDLPRHVCLSMGKVAVSCASVDKSCCLSVSNRLGVTVEDDEVKSDECWMRLLSIIEFKLANDVGSRRLVREI